mmetsp:Transcript_28323/g.69719  ORF Transcript_28323/g.69719 Transcript_28323/m.69719 type:complete len:215 (-) Transcript_28323:582-1226(-)
MFIILHTLPPLHLSCVHACVHIYTYSLVSLAHTRRALPSKHAHWVCAPLTSPDHFALLCTTSNASHECPSAPSSGPSQKVKAPAKFLTRVSYPPPAPAILRVETRSDTAQYVFFAVEDGRGGTTSREPLVEHTTRVYGILACFCAAVRCRCCPHCTSRLQAASCTAALVHTVSSCAYCLLSFTLSRLVYAVSSRACLRLLHHHHHICCQTKGKT